MDSIKALSSLLKQFNISFSEVDESFCHGWKSMSVKIENEIYLLHLDDEYQDLENEIPELTLCVILRNLEEFKDSSDYVNWCKSTGIDQDNPQTKNYFQYLSTVVPKIELIIGEIDSCISNYDFTLNAGEAQKLRQKSINN